MKFSIVTPVYNGERHIAETIESVLSQEGDFEIEYVVRDGGSTDNTMKIVRSYEKRLHEGNVPVRCRGVSMRSFSKPDEGMYDAVEKGFVGTHGEVMAYINADDRYLPGAFSAVAAIFEKFGDVAWAKGVNVTTDENGTVTNTGTCFIYRQEWLQKGIYGRSAPFVQQDSVFWRRNLWNRSHPRVERYRLAGDYALWRAFAAETPLWSFDQPVSVFRKRLGQLSEDMAPYRAEQERIAPHHRFLEKRVALFFSLIRMLALDPREWAARATFFLLFPFSFGWWYIELPSSGPVKKRSASYIP